MFNAQDIITIVAIIVPSLAAIIPAILNNRHQRKLKLIDIYEKKAIETIEKYIHHVNTFYFIGKSPDNDFTIVRDAIYLYVDPSLWHLVDEINAAVDSKQPQIVFDKLPVLCKQLQLTHLSEAHITKKRNLR